MSRASSLRTIAIGFVLASSPETGFAQSRAPGHSSAPSTPVRPGFNHTGNNSGAPSGRSSRYPGRNYYTIAAYPVFVGGGGLYGYGFGDGSSDPSAPAPDQAVDNSASQPAPPVVINQYFSSPAPQPSPGSQAPPTNSASQQLQEQSMPESNPGDEAEPPEPRTYLIAYKDHSVYSALAYWVEDHTLHYVTTSNTHNQSDLSLIDIEFTGKLNDDRNMPFSVAVPAK